jgi:hypothetical protein
MSCFKVCVVRVFSRLRVRVVRLTPRIMRLKIALRYAWEAYDNARLKIS